jgi:hypothetical protein
MKTKSTAAAASAAAASEADSDETIPLPCDQASLDPLDPRRVSLDIFEVYCHEMLTTAEVGRRAFLIKKMRVSICSVIGGFDANFLFLLLLLLLLLLSVVIFVGV